MRYSYRVTAVNEGGESMPSEILSACRMPEERGRVLVINGFDRVCAPYSTRLDSLAGFYRDIDPGVPDRTDISFVGTQRIFDLSQARNEREAEALGACCDDFETDVLGGNTFDYPALHGRSIAAAGYSYCSASVKAVERGELSLDGYDAADLILGLQRPATVARGVRGEEFPTFTPELRHALRRMAADGGALFVSGSYVTTELHTDDEQAFAAEVLHVAHDDGQTAPGGRVRVVTSRGGFSRGDYRYHDTPGREHSAVTAPDALRPADREAFAVMRYAGNGRMAGIASDEGRTFVLGFPFEALRDEQQRDRLMRDVLHFLIRNEKP